jgi:hypothetical protein
LTRRHHDWAAVIEVAAQSPGAWQLRYPNEPVRLAKRIRLRQHPDLRRTDGVLEATVMHEHTLDGVRRGDIWVRWVPTTRTTEHEE